MNQKIQLEKTENELIESNKRVDYLESLLSKNKQETEFLKFEKKKLKESFALKENQVIKQFESELKDKDEILYRLNEERQKEIEFLKKKEEKIQVIIILNHSLIFLRL